MLIPTKAKTSHTVSLLVDSFEDKDPAFDKTSCSPRGPATYVPVVSLEYSLPGPLHGGHRLPPTPHNSPCQALTPSRLRAPCHPSLRSNHVRHHIRNTLAVDCVDGEHQIQGIGLQRHDVLKPLDFGSSSTPSVPLSGSDLLYGGGGGVDGGAGGRPSAGGQGGSGEEAGEVGAWDHHHRSSHDKPKLRELDLHGNKRPPSRNNANNRKVSNFDKVPFDREREELRPLGNALGPAKQSPLRANGIKNNLLRADQFLSSQRTNGREDDLVAMGTIWNPSQLQTRGSSTGTNSSGKSTSAPTTTTTTSGGGGSGGGAGGSGGSGGPLGGRRPVNLSTNTSTRQLLHHGGGGGGGSFGNGAGPGGMGGLRAAKEVEPKYSDPLSGANPSFQQRLMELAALESETVRWERTKKIKKKPKQDRDS